MNTQPSPVLVKYHQSQQPSGTSWPRCPTKGHLVLRRFASGQVTYGRCGRLRCHACITPAVYDRAAAISLARPSHLITLTQVGPAWNEIKAGVQLFVRALKALAGPVEAAYHVEVNPAGTGNHVHMWARTKRVTRPSIALAAERAHLGPIVDVRRVDLPRDGERLTGATYGMKACLRRPDGASSLWPQAEEYLHLNGDRLEHHTQGYYLDRGGAQVGVRRAEAEARAAYGLSGGWHIAGLD